MLVFIMKLVLYLYSRFLLSVLYTVLVIPRDLQIPRRQSNRASFISQAGPIAGQGDL